ncbi:type II secretion system protein [Plesiomonas shigelloides]|uniref:type II secretion system protein n=1 Tax=Plesiomonas shigelloides TaxID=703 RepID=UPI002247EDD6|nr:type II secretion system protein [Plesiomonas shigelloides]MCX2532317.1 type II secretion system protein [Plesiomonas shigelloides]
MQKGMTLVELLVAIVVAVILISVALPSYQLMKTNQEIESNSKLIYSYLQRVKHIADNANSVVRVYAINDLSGYCFVAVYQAQTADKDKCESPSGLPVLKHKTSKILKISVNGGGLPASPASPAPPASLLFTFNGIRGLAGASNVVIGAPNISGAADRKIFISSVARLRECKLTTTDNPGGQVCS